MRRVLLVLLALAVPGAHASWESFHADERNTGFQSGTAYKVYEDVWWNLKVEPATQMEASPVVSGNTVIIAGWDKTVRALDAESGKPKWSATFTGKIVGTPAISNSRVFVVDATGALKSFDLERGTELGSATVGATLAHLAVHEGKVFIGNEAGEMKAFDTETLTLLWKFSINSIAEATVTTTTGTGTSAVTTTTCGTKIPTGQIRGAPAVYRNKVIFGSLNHWVFAVDELGEPGQTTFAQWIFKAEDAIFSSPVIDHVNGRVLVGGYDEKMYALAATPSGEGPISTGTGAAATVCTAYRNTPTWTFNVPATVGQSKVHSTPALDGTRAYVGANNGHVYGVWLSNGTKAWDFTTENAVTASPAVSNGIVVVGSDDGKVYWLYAGNGTQAKAFLADAAIKANPAIDGNRTYVASFEGSVYMFGPKVPARADLRIAGITFADGVVTVQVRNSGNAASSASALRLTIDGALAGDISVPVIAAGETTAVTFASKLAVGDHIIAAQADQANAVRESEESNNERTQTVTVASSKKDDKAFGIPGPSLGLALLALGALVLNRRR